MRLLALATGLGLLALAGGFGDGPIGAADLSPDKALGLVPSLTQPAPWPQVIVAASKNSP